MQMKTRKSIKKILQNFYYSITSGREKLSRFCFVLLRLLIESGFVINIYIDLKSCKVGKGVDAITH